MYSDLFGLGRKIAQIATEKWRFDILDTLDQILEELYDTNENANESSSKIINPHLVRSKTKDLKVLLKIIKILTKMVVQALLFKIMMSKLIHKIIAKEKHVVIVVQLIIILGDAQHHVNHIKEKVTLI